MQYQISNFKFSVNNKTDLKDLIKNKYKVKDFSYKIISKSIDARNKNDIYS